MLRYALAIFLSAFLLFQIQPLISKWILPWFGGTPAVWTTCVLFFQVLLLGGYAYAHLVATKLSQRRQVVVHVALLAAAAALLPIAPGAGWKPQSVADPTWQILALLAACVGLPYFALATTSPLLQAWFHRTHAGRSPYRLYALSNAGSLLALLSFPFVFEPSLRLRTQATAWGWAFAAAAAAIAWCAVRTWNAEPAAEAVAEADGPPPGIARRLMWVALPACASVMLLAVTNQMCQDVAVVPFLWVLPLSLYLLSFIICFDRERLYFRPVFWPWLAAAMGTMVWLLKEGVTASIEVQVIGYSAALFGVCMVCHGELIRLKPSPRHLTSFYLLVSLGGALGGVFVSIVAPLLFKSYLELHFGMWATCAIAMVAFWTDRRPHRHWPASWISRIVVSLYLVVPAAACVFRPNPAIGLFDRVAAAWHVPHHQAPMILLVGAWLALGIVGLLGWLFCTPPGTWRWRWLSMLCLPVFVSGLVVLASELHSQFRSVRYETIDLSRNFYGMLQVCEYSRHDPENHLYLLCHGRIDHGCQLQSPEGRRRPITYFGEASGIGLALLNLPRGDDGLRVGILGLGSGTLAAYGRKGDHYRFYEINPEVKRIATSVFTYVPDSAADCQIVLGDGRLSLEREPSQGFDLLAMDAFTSDAVPVHLLTREAFEIYLSHVKKPDGIIAVNISNRFLDLVPVCRALAEHFVLHSLQVDSKADRSRRIYTCSWMLMSRSGRLFETPVMANAAAKPPEGPQRSILWTDDYSDLFRILR